VSALTVAIPRTAHPGAPTSAHTAEVPDAPEWATHLRPYSNGSTDAPAHGDDMRSFVKVIGDHTWDTGASGGHVVAQHAAVMMKLDDITDPDRERYTVGPYIKIEADPSGLMIADPWIVRALAQSLLDAADALEDSVG